MLLPGFPANTPFRLIKYQVRYFYHLETACTWNGRLVEFLLELKWFSPWYSGYKQISFNWRHTFLHWALLLLSTLIHNGVLFTGVYSGLGQTCWRTWQIWRTDSCLLCKIFKELGGLVTGAINMVKGWNILTLKGLACLMTMGRLSITLGKAISKDENNMGFSDKQDC